MKQVDSVSSPHSQTSHNLHSRSQRTTNGTLPTAAGVLSSRADRAKWYCRKSLCSITLSSVFQGTVPPGGGRGRHLKTHGKSAAARGTGAGGQASNSAQSPQSLLSSQPLRSVARKRRQRAADGCCTSSSHVARAVLFRRKSLCSSTFSRVFQGTVPPGGGRGRHLKTHGKSAAARGTGAGAQASNSARSAQSPQSPQSRQLLFSLQPLQPVAMNGRPRAAVPRACTARWSLQESQGPWSLQAMGPLEGRWGVTWGAGRL